MLTYSDYFTPIPATDTFFAGANTYEGFRGEYENLLSEDSFEKIYIIKGGSGTGKSTLIKKCKSRAAEAGCRVTTLLCSSDPKSLDGVIMKKGEKQIAIIDGTPPHTREPVYPGACGEIVNTGDFWDSSVLEKRKAEIAGYTKEKGKAYKTAYNYLSAAGNVFRLSQRLASHYIEKEKMESAVERICHALGKGTGSGRVFYRRTCAVSMRGAVRLTSLEGAKTVFGVLDRSYISPIFFACLKEKLTASGLDIFVSESPIGGISEIYVPRHDVAFVPYREEGEYTKVINMRRFADSQGLGEVKQKRIFASKCMSCVIDGALESLSLAREHHFALEEIYKDAMDFEGLDSLCDSLSLSILKRFS
jgi:hypothetical protein